MTDRIRNSALQSGWVSRVVQKVRLRLLALPRRTKQAVMVAADIASYSLAVAVSLWVVPDAIFEKYAILTIFGASVLIAVPVHYQVGFYRSIVRYMGFALLAIAFKATLLVSTVIVAIGLSLGPGDAVVRFGIVFWSISVILVVGARTAARAFLSRRNRHREPVIIYGAGQGGAQLTEALFGADDYLPIALIDDKRSLHGSRVHGLKVYSSNVLGDIIGATGATGVLLAIPGASRRRRRKVLQRLSEFPIRVQTMPELRDIVEGKARVEDISDIDVKDLLGRDPVPPSPRLLGACITGKSVMVTGAGGSIGSELCRQILALEPTRLVCFERSETALYQIDRELRRLVAQFDSGCEIVTLLGSVCSEDRMREVMEVFGVRTVYHAAAYKHVPIVEHNMFEGVYNNIFGTLRATKAALAANVETFVLISTDKAVNPTNIMGATKRFAELIVQALDSSATSMKCCMVRFGNVLESSGSVVPLFREQILDGGPVTVTHRDIIRYFMTIPEAAQLVIQAGSMAQGGDVFVLDMGKPVRISDLARRMINLMGLSVRDENDPDGDIEIRYVGLRPAEKLYEELIIGSNAEGTEHPRILRANEDSLGEEILARLLEELVEASEQLDYDRARQVLFRAVKEYAPTNGLEDLVWLRKSGGESRSDRQTIVDFPQRI